MPGIGAPGHQPALGRRCAQRTERRQRIASAADLFTSCGQPSRTTCYGSLELEEHSPQTARNALGDGHDRRRSALAGGAEGTGSLIPGKRTDVIVVSVCSPSMTWRVGAPRTFRPDPLSTSETSTSSRSRKRRVDVDSNTDAIAPNGGHPERPRSAVPACSAAPGWGLQKLHPFVGSVSGSSPTPSCRGLDERLGAAPDAVGADLEVEVGGAGAAGVAGPQDLLAGGDGVAEA